MHNITLKTLPSATLQQVFEQAATHLLTQNEPSENGDGCMYHHPSGLKCAAGCFISEEEYSPDFEKITWSMLATKSLVPHHHAEFITFLQKIHDTEIIPEWKYALENLGKRYNLDTSFLNIIS